MMCAQPLPQPNPYLARIIVWLARPVFKVYFRLECIGCESVREYAQRERPLMLVFNHSSNLDMPIIAVCIGQLASRLSLPGKREVFDNWKTGWFMRLLGGFPLDRQRLDLEATRTLVHCLNAGRIVALAPEGTRSQTGEVFPFRSGFVKLAMRTRAVVLPVGIQGAYQALPRRAIFPRPRKIVVRFGNPVDPSTLYSKEVQPQVYDELAEMVRQEVIRLCGQGDGS